MSEQTECAPFLADVLLPIIAAHMAERERAAAEKAWNECLTDHRSWMGFEHNPHRRA